MFLKRAIQGIYAIDVCINPVAPLIVTSVVFLAFTTMNKHLEISAIIGSLRL